MGTRRSPPINHQPIRVAVGQGWRGGSSNGCITVDGCICCGVIGCGGGGVLEERHRWVMGTRRSPPINHQPFGVAGGQGWQGGGSVWCVAVGGCSSGDAIGCGRGGILNRTSGGCAGSACIASLLAGSRIGAQRGDASEGDEGEPEECDLGGPGAHTQSKRSSTSPPPSVIWLSWSRLGASAGIRSDTAGPWDAVGI